ncbi:MAG: ketoacyl-ACP synthase III [Nitrospirae bacterium]|nr:ketoacyl-ACP synthase III [Nitrospirota bacterium]
MKGHGVYIAGTGSYLPDERITNEVLSGDIGLTPEDIVRMTGIKERRRAGPEEATSDLATHAAASALQAAGVEARNIDLIVLATTSPDMHSPATACFVQRNIGAQKAAAFDINASCSGFLYALNVAEMFIRSGQADTALVIAAEVKSRFVNPGDKETAILFGDGAGAVVLQEERGGLNEGDRESSGRNIISTRLYADGNHWNWIHLPAGGSRIPASPATIAADLHTMRMDGSKVYKAAIKTLSRMVVDIVKDCGLRMEDIDHFIFHQANLRIIEQVIRRTGIPKEKVPLSLPSYGNTSSASIPITLDQTVRNGRIKEGDIVALASFGGGLTWGASIVRW